MNLLTNEMIFYAGVIIVVFSIIISAVYFSIAKIKKVRLATQLEKEYGEDKTKRK